MTFPSFRLENKDVVCLSHLRWDSVFQRPHHLMSRFARTGRVLFVEEPVLEPGTAYMQVSRRDGGITVVTPHVPPDLTDSDRDDLQRQLLDTVLDDYRMGNFVLWYYTPMAIEFTRHLEPLAVVYDCMDELSAFSGAPLPLRERESELFGRADLVFTGGQSLYEAKRDRHDRVYAFPSSVEAAHFARARELQGDPPDQVRIPHPRLGFFGVIDERMDLELVRGIAEAHPDWHQVFVGPVIKIDPAWLPRRPNIHYLGPKAYTLLPEYLAGWDVALLPFARNDATRFISPTKTPEYLAGGRRVVSTAIHDVVHPYGDAGLVRIADGVSSFIAAIEAALANEESDREFAERVDAFLARTSWDQTWEQMNDLIQSLILDRRVSAAQLGGRAAPARATVASAAE